MLIFETIVKRMNGTTASGYELEHTYFDIFLNVCTMCFINRTLSLFISNKLNVSTKSKVSREIKPKYSSKQKQTTNVEINNTNAYLNK